MKTWRFLCPVMAGFVQSVVLAAGCESPRRVVQVFFPDGSKVIAELAVSDEERQLGLMYRPKINDDQGMLFVFEEEGRHAFWMRNMRFSIDILWLDKDRRIVHIERRVPPCAQEPCPSYPSPLPAQYVLEIRSGGAEARNLKLYDRLDFVLPHVLLSR